MSFNARSVVRKWLLICAELLTYNPDVIAITESWLADYMVKFYNYNNYQSFSKCRAGGSGGGVLLLLSSSFSVGKSIHWIYRLIRVNFCRCWTKSLAIVGSLSIGR